MIVSLVGGWVLKAFVGTALEGAAGRFVGGRLFGYLLAGVAAVGLYLGLWYGLPKAIAIHDARVAAAAVAKHNLKVQLALQEARAKALEEAVAKQRETLSAREGDLEALRVELEKLEKEKRDAREASPNGSAVVVAPGDPWLRSKPR